MSENDNPLASMLSRFHGICPKVTFAVLFECDGCCVKVLNVEDIDEEKGFITLTPPQSESLKILVISEGRVVLKEEAAAVIFPKERLCAIEVETPERKFTEM